MMESTPKASLVRKVPNKTDGHLWRGRRMNSGASLLSGHGPLCRHFDGYIRPRALPCLMARTGPSAARISVSPIRLLLAAIVAWAAANAYANADVNLLASFKMHFREESPLPLIVPVTIDRHEYRFEIDTGMSHTMFGLHLRPLLGRPHGWALGWTATGSTRLDSFRGPRVYLGDLPLPVLNQVRCHDIKPAERAKGTVCDGILGVDALRDLVVQLDFDMRAIRLLRSAPPDAGERLQFIVPGLVPLVVGTLGSRERWFQLDTGSNGHLALMKADFDALVKRGDLLPAGARVLTSLSGQRQSRVGVLNTLFGLGSQRRPAIVVNEIPNSDLRGTPTAIGLGYMSRFLVTFDFPNNAVYLKPGASISALVPSVDLFGVRLARDENNDIIISSIAENSRAAKWGRAGDVVEAINGEPARKLSDAELVRRLSDCRRERIVDFRRPADGRKTWMKLFAVRVGNSASKHRPGESVDHCDH